MLSYWLQITRQQKQVFPHISKLKLRKNKQEDSIIMIIPFKPLFVVSITITITLLLLLVTLVHAAKKQPSQKQEQPMVSDDDVPSYDQARLPQYIKRVKDHINDASAWGQLAYAMLDDESVEIQGKTYKKLECYKKALELNPSEASSWYNLGVHLGYDLDKDTIVVNKVRYNKLELLIKAVESNPKLAVPWYNIGTLIEGNPDKFPDQTAVIRGIKTSLVQCYVNALNNDNRLPNAWNNVGTALSNPNDFVMIDGAKYTKKQCFIEELENTPNHGSAWYNLATAMELSKSVFVEVNDEKLTRKKCLLNALRYNPHQPGAWHNLATLLSNAREKVKIVIDANKKAGLKKKKTVFMNSTRCEEEALKMEPKLAIAWFGAATKMLDGGQEVLRVGGKRYDKVASYLKAIELEPQWADPWNNLATAIDEKVPIELPFLKKSEDDTETKTSFTAKELVIHSINLDPEVGRTWRNLCIMMSDDEKVTVDGGVYTRSECDSHADELLKTGSERGRGGKEDFEKKVFNVTPKY